MGVANTVRIIEYQRSAKFYSAIFVTNSFTFYCALCSLQLFNVRDVIVEFTTVIDLYLQYKLQFCKFLLKVAVCY